MFDRILFFIFLTLSYGSPYHKETSSYRNWFLYDRDFRHDKVKTFHHSPATCVSSSEKLVCKISWITQRRIQELLTVHKRSPSEIFLYTQLCYEFLGVLEIIFRNTIFRTPLCVSLHKKIKFSIKDFFSKCDQVRRKLWIWSYLLRKSLMKNFIFCTVSTSEQYI